MSLQTDSQTVEFDGFRVTMAIPVDWKRTPLAIDSVTFTRPSHSFANSVFWLSATCQGNCSTLAANIARSCQTQVDAHGTYYTDGIDILEDSELPGGGREFLLDLRRGTSLNRQVVRFVLQPDWPKAVMCSFMAVQPDDVENFEAFRQLFDHLQIEKS